MEGWQTFASKNAFLSREIFGLKKLKWSKENFKALAPQMPLAYNGFEALRWQGIGGSSARLAVNSA